MPRATKSRTHIDRPAPYPKDASPSSTSNNNHPATTTSATAPATDPLEFLSTPLENPADEAAEVVYDQPEEIRRKIRAFFRDPKFAGVTQKRFLEVIGNVNSNSYRRFMSKKKGGEENGTFIGAYFFFERKRIFEKKPKSKKRLENERLFPEGIPLKDSNRPVYVTCETRITKNGRRVPVWPPAPHNRALHDADVAAGQASVYIPLNDNQHPIISIPAPPTPPTPPSAAAAPSQSLPPASTAPAGPVAVPTAPTASPGPLAALSAAAAVVPVRTAEAQVEQAGGQKNVDAPNVEPPSQTPA